MASAVARPGEEVYGWRPAWADVAVRLRPWLLGLWLLVHLAAFNGQWRVGTDSAIYRSVARSLASGHGYAMAGVPHDHVYPGLPYLLAWLERAFGPAAWPGVAVMLGASLATVLLTYALVRQVCPAWAATVVTAGVAFNWRFVMQGHELLTDMPFLLGTTALLAGLDWLRGPRAWVRVAGAATAASGLAVAASMRPTVWVLVAAAVAWAGLAAVRELSAGGRRATRAGLMFGIAVVGVAALTAGFAAIDPRASAGVAGAYERELVERVAILVGGGIDVFGGVWDIVNGDLPRLFFAERVVVLNVLLTLGLLAGVALVGVRADDPNLRRPLWPLVVFVLAVVCVVLSSAPRYWLMVLPVLWMGWLLGLMRGLSHINASAGVRSAVLLVAVAGVIVANIAHVMKFVAEQRATPFLDRYKGGQHAPLFAFARVLADRTREDDVIIGPHPTVLSFLTGRRVLTERDLGFPWIDDVPGRLVAVRDSGARWVVFPDVPYHDRDRKIGRLIRDGLVYAANESEDEAITLVVRGSDGVDRAWWAASFHVDERLLPPDQRTYWPADDVPDDELVAEGI